MPNRTIPIAMILGSPVHHFARQTLCIPLFAIVVSSRRVGCEHTYLNYLLILFKFHDKFKTLKMF